MIGMTEDWATARARELVAKWEHGDEAHRQWLREIAIPDLAAALREVASLRGDQSELDKMEVLHGLPP